MSLTRLARNIRPRTSPSHAARLSLAGQYRGYAFDPVNKPPHLPEPEEFRPPWMFFIGRFGSWVFIPATFLYGMFYYDFGDKEHVFSPARRWAARQKSAIFELSPEEKKLLEKSERHTEPELSTTTTTPDSAS